MLEWDSKRRGDGVLVQAEELRWTLGGRRCIDGGVLLCGGVSALKVMQDVDEGRGEEGRRSFKKTIFGTHHLFIQRATSDGSTSSLRYGD